MKKILIWLLAASLLLTGCGGAGGEAASDEKGREEVSEPTVPEHLASWGNLGVRTYYIDDSSIGVRPAVWVRTSALSA